MPVLGDTTTVQAPSSTTPIKNEAVKTMNKAAVQSSPNVPKPANTQVNNNNNNTNNNNNQQNAGQQNKNGTPNKAPVTQSNNSNNNTKPNQNNNGNGPKNNFNKSGQQNNGLNNQQKNGYNNNNNKAHFDKSKNFNKAPFDKSKYNYNKNDQINKQGGQGGGFHSNKFNNQNGSGYTTNNHHYNDNKYDNRDQTASADKKFTGRCRLFCGNLPQDLTEEDFKDLFKKFGETGECFLNTQRSFGFIKLDTRINAEHAKQELDGTQFKGRTIRVRFATHGAAVRVKNLSPFISNEYLEQAFSMFGPVERAVVIVDDKGRPTGEGIVEFERKPASIQCINKCQENCFILTSYPRPIVVEPLEQKDEEDGLPEKSIIKNNQFYMEREAPPHFANNNSNEHKLALRWRELYELEKQINEEGKRRVDQAREMLEYEIEQAIIDNKTMQLKEDMRMKQEELQRIEDMRKAEFVRRQDMEMRRVDEERQRQEQMAMARKLQEQGGGVPNQRGGNGMFDQSIQQNQQGGAQGAMQSGNQRRNNNNNQNGGNNGANNNYNSQQQQQQNQQQQNFNNADLSSLPQDQQQAIIAAQLSFAMAAAAQQGGLNMGGMNDGGYNNNNNFNNGQNNNQKHHKDDNRGNTGGGNSRRFDRRGGNRGGHNNNRDDSYPGYDTKRARF